MLFVRKFRELFAFAEDDGPLLRAQLRAMERQVPLLYIILSVSIWALGIHFLGSAPVYLSIGFPMLVMGFVVMRLLDWARRKEEELPLLTIVGKLKGLIVVTIFTSLMISAWAWVLDGYANDLQRAHIGFFIAITMMSTAFSMGQFAPAARASAIVGGLAFLSYAVYSREMAMIGLAINFIVVLFVVSALISHFNHAFSANVRSRHRLKVANDEMSKLNLELLYHRDNLAHEVRKRTEELETQALKLEQALSQEKELNQMQNQFVSMVSHEFRTPLTVIDATARRVEKRADSMPVEEIVDRMGRVRSNVKRLSGLVERTLDASKLANGSIEYDPSEFDPAPLVQEIIDRHAEMSPDAEIKLTMGNLPPLMNGDQRLLDHMLSNVLSNAIKYSKPDPKVDVRFEAKGEQVFFTVRDNGVGIPAEDLKRVSERFFRASTSAGIPGTGIGLNLVATLVDMHSGCMCIESEEGKWTEVMIALPIDGRTDHVPCGGAAHCKASTSCNSDCSSSACSMPAVLRTTG